MILLSALLASLTGLVAGERPTERAQVELSAVAAIVQSGEVAAKAVVRPIVQPRPARAVVQTVSTDRTAQVRAPRALLSLKQSWLI